MDASPDLPHQGRVPVFNLPRVVTVSIAVLAVIHVVRTVLPDELDLSVLLNLAFIPARWTAAFDPASAAEIVRAAGEGAGRPDIATARQEFARYLVAEPSAMPWTGATYALLHGSWVHLIFNAVWLAVFGTPVARRYGVMRYGLLALAGVVVGALVHLFVDPYSLMPLVGASAGISALMAAAARFVFQPPPSFGALAIAAAADAADDSGIAAQPPGGAVPRGLVRHQPAVRRPGSAAWGQRRADRLGRASRRLRRRVLPLAADGARRAPRAALKAFRERPCRLRCESRSRRQSEVLSVTCKVSQDEL